MKRMTNNNFIQKIVIGILIVLSFNFVAPTFSRADFGGVLMGPLIDFVAGVGDAILSAAQYFMFDGNVTVTSSVAGAVSGAVKTINPFDSFLLDKKDFVKSIEEKGLEPTETEKKNPNVVIDAEDLDHGWFGLGDYGVPIITYTPEKIFSNKVPALDVNYINPQVYTTKDYPNYTEEQLKAMNDKSITQALQKTISSWYKALRNLAIVGLLSVLLYVGIRIIISSASSEKAKYKQMLMDWAIALCLLFFLHYIMLFTLTITESITDGLSASNKITVQVDDKEVEGGSYTYTTDLTGLCRMQINNKELSVRLVYLIFYIALVVYTIMFTWQYVKRAITMAFLTLIAPVVALTYPIDKISDGKAQAFNFWLKEYIFNALLQPFHLILYSIFLGSSLQIAVKNPIFAILFLAFITPAEKILRKMFGFEKAATASAGFNGALGGAAAYSLLNKGVSRLISGNKGKASGGGGKSDIKTKATIKEKHEVGEDLSAFANPGISSRSSNDNSSQEGQQNDDNDMYLNPAKYQNEQQNTTELGTRSANPSLQSSSNNANNSTNGVRQKLGDMRTSASELYGRTAAIANEKLDNMGRTGKVIRGVANVAGKPMRYVADKAGYASRHKLDTLKAAAKKGTRLATRGVAIGTIGAAGIGMGIAGSDLEDVAKYGLGGAVLGGSLGRSLADIGGTVAHSINTAYQEGYYGEEHLAALEAQEGEWQANEANKEFFGSKFNVEGKELEDKMEQASFYHRNGITGNKEIAQAIKLEESIKTGITTEDITEEQRTKMAKDQAATIANIADRYDTEELRTNEEYRAGVYNDFKNGLKKVNPDMGERELKQQSEQMMKLLKKFKKID